MPEAVWNVLNAIVGIPVAIVLIGWCRECLRVLFALTFGFRVFEIKWGAGRRIWAKQIGPVEFVLGSLPLVGSTIAESGSPKHHRIGRLSQAGGPLLIQIAGAIWGTTHDLMMSDALRSNFAPVATLQLANTFLIGLHGLVPIETKTGFRTDIRSILDLAFGRAEMNRHARASYYARYARYWLERSEVERAKSVLGRGLTQLGPNSLMVGCQTRITAGDLSSVVDQSECADALRALIEEAAPRRRRDRDMWSVREHIRQAAMTALPLTLAGFGIFALESERLSRLVQDHLIVTGDAVAEAGIATNCEGQLARWRRWSPVLDLFLPDDPGPERDRHDQLARLEQCRGQLEAASEHWGRAISTAQRAATQSSSLVGSDSDLWLENEIRLAIILRQAAKLDSERNRYRLALSTLGRAANQLDLARNRITAWDEPDWKTRADGFIEIQEAQIHLARLQVLTRMGAPRMDAQ